MAEVKGHCDPEFSKLREILAANVVNGEDLGASICVNVNGRNVVDIWDGYIDEDRKSEWQENTIVNVWSCSKTVTNLAVLMAHDRGLLSVYDKISKHWPEFAENGKQDIEIRHILSHSTGVSGWEEEISMAGICDADKAAAMLAKQAPWWDSRTTSGYHATTQGHLAGELIKRVTGKPLKQFIHEQIAKPLGADFQLGAVEKDWPRISTLLPPPSLASQVGAIDPESVAMKTLTRPLADAMFAFTPEWRNGEVGAANGHANARALVRIMSVISNGGEIDGVRLLSPKTIDLIFEEQTNGVDLVLGQPIRFGIGYGLPTKELPWIPEGKSCFWGGWGGSSIIMDLDNKITLSYVMNRMAPGTLGSPRTIGYVQAIYNAIEKGPDAKV